MADIDWRENTATIHGNEVYVYWKCKLNNQVCILRDYMGETIDSIIDQVYDHTLYMDYRYFCKGFTDGTENYEI